MNVVSEAFYSTMQYNGWHQVIQQIYSCGFQLLNNSVRKFSLPKGVSNYFKLQLLFLFNGSRTGSFDWVKIFIRNKTACTIIKNFTIHSDLWSTKQSKNGRDLLIKTLNSPSLSCTRMWSTREISLLSTFKCGLQTIIWIHLVFLIYFSWSWANIIKNNQQLSRTKPLPVRQQQYCEICIFLQGSLYVQLTRLVYLFIVTYCCAIFVEFEHI